MDRSYYNALTRQINMSKETKDPNQDVYKLHLLTQFMEDVVCADEENYRNQRKRWGDTQRKILKKNWGENENPLFTISPSTASNCLRWAGYELSNLKPRPPEFKDSLAKMIGSGAHRDIINKLRGYGIGELNLATSEDPISGRLDFIFKNPATQEWQIVDFKFTNDFGFKQITRDGVPDYLRNSKTYSPSKEARKQILLYMFLARKQGYKVEFGNVIYLNKNTGDVKECLIPWDSVAEHDTNLFLEEIRSAYKTMSEGNLPEPSVESPHICARFCPYTTHCDYGQRFAAGEIKKQKKRRPAWVMKQAKQKAAIKREKMEKAGIVQPELFPRS